MTTTINSAMISRQSRRPLGVKLPASELESKIDLRIKKKKRIDDFDD